jgi:C-terminal processing protease CtpA/Prc
VKVDWPAVLSETLTAAATDPDQAAFDKTMRRLVAKAQDGHGRVGLPSQAPFADAPVRVGWVENSLAVVAVAGQGAEGVKPGDVVVSVGGKPAAQALADAEELISGATPQWRRFRSTSELFWGPKDSVVTLGLRPDAGTGAARTVTLRRTLPAFGEGALPVGPVRPAKIAEPRPGVLYVDLDRVSDAELKETLPKLAAAKGVVFDMRGYPRVGAGFLGNLSDKPVTSARWGVPTVAAPDHAKINFEEGRWPPMGPTEPRIKGKVVFLTDGRAISYAESVMGIVENYKLGEIVGEPTAGTNGNINGVAAPGGYTVIFTGMRVLKHDGSRHHGVGIAPTVPQPLTLRGLAAGRDDQLERALSLATGGS